MIKKMYFSIKNCVYMIQGLYQKLRNGALVLP